MGYAAFTASCAESHWLSVKPSTHVAATPPGGEASYLFWNRPVSQRLTAMCCAEGAFTPKSTQH